MDKETEIARIKAARPELNEQEFRTVIYQEIELENYIVSWDGLVISYVKYKEGYPLTWVAIGTIGRKYPAVKLMLPADKISFEKSNVNFNANTNKVGRAVAVHTLVANAWMDIENNCPPELDPYWHLFPLEAKNIMRPYFQLDHIDDNKLNAHVSNLRFVSSRVNNRHTKAQLLGDNPKEKLEMQNKVDKLIKEQRNGY